MENDINIDLYEWFRVVKKYLPRKTCLTLYGDRIKEIRRIRRIIYLYSSQFDRENMRNLISKEQYDNALDCYLNFSKLDKYLERLIIYDNQKSSRLNKRVEKMLNEFRVPVFFTITFTDEVLESTSSEFRRNEVKKWLKENCEDYVANIDFGDSEKYFDDLGIIRQGTHREHYHAITSNIINGDTWLYGFAYGEVIKRSSDSKAMSKYLCKLTNHALKRSTKFNRVIYCRRRKRD